MVSHYPWVSLGSQTHGATLPNESDNCTLAPLIRDIDSRGWEKTCLTAGVASQAGMWKTLAARAGWGTSFVPILGRYYSNSLQLTSPLYAAI